MSLDLFAVVDNRGTESDVWGIGKSPRGEIVTDAQLLAAQRQREDRLLDAAIDTRLEALFAQPEPGVSEADTVGPHARHKLRGLLRYYAKKDHPFTACVHDNMKRFGPNRTERVCATVKDIIRGTTHWRGHPELDHGAPGAVAASDMDETTDDRVLEWAFSDPQVTDFLCSLSESHLEILFSDSRKAVQS
jgi:hypothetical protein